MRSSFLAAFVLALASSVVAQTPGFDVISSPTQDQTVAVGSTFNIVWDPAGQTGTVTISLLQGATVGTLSIGPTLASSINNTLGTFAWTIPASAAGFATYGFKILLDSTASSASPTFQYSRPFHLSGGPSASVTGSTTSTATVLIVPGPSFLSSSNTTSSAPKTTSAAAKTSASSNATVVTTVPSTSASKTGSSSSTTPSGTTTTKNAAAGNIATGGLALVGGLILAMVL